MDSLGMSLHYTYARVASVCPKNCAIFGRSTWTAKSLVWFLSTRLSAPRLQPQSYYFRITLLIQRVIASIVLFNQLSRHGFQRHFAGPNQQSSWSMETCKVVALIG